MLRLSFYSPFLFLCATANSPRAQTEADDVAVRRSSERIFAKQVAAAAALLSSELLKATPQVSTDAQKEACAGVCDFWFANIELSQLFRHSDSLMYNGYVVNGNVH